MSDPWKDSLAYTLGYGIPALLLVRYVNGHVSKHLFSMKYRDSKKKTATFHAKTVGMILFVSVFLVGPIVVGTMRQRPNVSSAQSAEDSLASLPDAHAVVSASEKSGHFLLLLSAVLIVSASYFFRAWISRLPGRAMILAKEWTIAMRRPQTAFVTLMLWLTLQLGIWIFYGSTRWARGLWPFQDYYSAGYDLFALFLYGVVPCVLYVAYLIKRQPASQSA